MKTVIQPQAGCYPGAWKGKFIWDDGEAVPFHYFLMIRKSFDLPAGAKDARLLIAAADKYMLYVNGKFMGRGPARSVGPYWTMFDTYDLGGKLAKGKNVIAVLAHYYGAINHYSQNQRSGFWSQVELSKMNGKKEIFGTDATWKVRHAEGYRQDVEMVMGMHGTRTEVLDACKDPADWMSRDYDDAGWQAATAINPCWSLLEPSPTTPLRERELRPVAIAALGEARELTNCHGYVVVKDTQVPERLATEQHFPLEHATIKNAEALIGGKKGRTCFQSAPQSVAYTAAKGPGSRDPFIILDFGRPIFGFPRIVFEAPARTVVELTYTVQLVNGRAPCLEQASRYGNAYIAREGRQVWQLFEPRLFRYLQVVFRNVANQLALNPGDIAGYKELLVKNNRPIEVESIKAVSYEYPAEVKGSFECSDPVLTKLWKAGVDTVYLSMEDTFAMDAHRERLLYVLMGEIEQSHLIIQAGFGDLPFTDHHFRQTTRMQYPDGQFPLFMRGGLYPAGLPGGKLPLGGVNMYSIQNYPTFYAQAVHNRFWFTGRLEFLEEHYPALVKTAGWFVSHANGEGLLANLPGWNWCDWTENEMRGANFETNALYYRMLLDLTELAQALELPRDERKWSGLARRVRDALQKSHWNATAGLFADSVIDGRQSPIFTELANAFALLYGIATEEQAERILRRLTDPRPKEVVATFNLGSQPFIQKQWSNPPVKMSCTSPLYFYYVIEALTCAGAGDVAVKYLSRRFEAMMRDERPMLHEAWLQIKASDMTGAMGHTGCGGVVWYLPSKVLGIAPAKPGFAACRIEPECGRLTWAKGTLPTSKGTIGVAWEKKGKAFVITVTVPDGMDTEVALPFPEGKTRRLTQDGKVLTVSGKARGDGVEINGGKAKIKVRGGKHEFRVE